MKFTIERAALVKMLEVIGRKAPSKKRRDKEMRLSACAPRVFVEANESTGGVEALVFEDGTCLLSHKTFLKLLKMHFPQKNILVEADEHKITFATTTLPVSGYSRTVTPPGKFKVFPVTDAWLSRGRTEATQIQGTKTSIKLPNADKAIVERDKILGYLLNPEHLIGASKARFFTKFGFSAEKWEQLAKALLVHGQTHDVKRVHETNFGPRCEVEGTLKTPVDREPLVRSVWQQDKGAVAPRLITAYPLEAR
jgi:hypothetical protein